MISILAFIAVDCVGTPVAMAGVGTVVDKHWRPSWIETHITTDEKGNISSWTEYHPDEYQLLVSFEGFTGSYYVDSSTYGRVRSGTNMTMNEQHGRMTGWRYVTLGEPITDGREW